MKVEANKVLIKKEVKSITLYNPPATANLNNHSFVESNSNKEVIVSSSEKKTGVLYSDQDRKCGEKIMAEVDGKRIDSPSEVFCCKYVIWVVSVDSIKEYSEVLDMATLYPEKLIIFWWRAAAIESMIDVTMMSSREIADSAFAFFPINGTYISSHAPDSFVESLQKMSQWIKQNKNPQGQRIKSQKFS